MMQSQKNQNHLWENRNILIIFQIPKMKASKKIHCPPAKTLRDLTARKMKVNSGEGESTENKAFLQS